MYPNTELFISGRWQAAAQGECIDVVNPATEQVIGTVAKAELADLDNALFAAKKGLAVWRDMCILERSNLMRRAATILREKVENASDVMSLEQGKPVAEASREVLSAADVIDWFAEEGRRTYGRVIPARAPTIQQLVVCEPVGVVAAFTPWNFPINQAVRKIASALAAGCSIIVKGPEETPASCALMVRAFEEAGIPEGVINLVFGIPAEISSYLISHPVVSKISFTGSTPVGKELAALAGRHMKRITMELGGHAPVIIFDDADIEDAVDILVTSKFRNAGQICISPTRFLLQSGIADQFIQRFVEETKKIRVGANNDSDMGPLINERRVEAIERLVTDAVECGATLQTGGHRIEGAGYFFEPTVLSGVPVNAQIMNEEPFGPVAPMMQFTDYDDAIREANRLNYGLAAYAFTGSGTTENKLARDIESGMLSINHYGLGIPETPFGGIKDSGFGTEGGADALQSYLITKFITRTINN
ncbi:NAD-dependent succinate-semialdehyde dehydrogenase [Candidatus Endobugula sertula]|uniref:NAD-dependent succinate-semialdehyde dehydrogenase n=1 Tax=Candidatus Endobugula sertula TaxID=62101 RepID=A0A1D2QM79_9GAMM|nr:NAD-dependent succinate-semialdehyde dehydrogenase [Candidatus Endobugula sertula]